MCVEQDTGVRSWRWFTGTWRHGTSGCIEICEGPSAPSLICVDNHSADCLYCKSVYFTDSHSHVTLYRHVWFWSDNVFFFLGGVIVIFPSALSIQALHLIFTRGVVLVLHMHWLGKFLKIYVRHLCLNSVYTNKSSCPNKLWTTETWNILSYAFKIYHAL